MHGLLAFKLYSQGQPSLVGVPCAHEDKGADAALGQASPPPPCSCRPATTCACFV